MKVKIAYFLGNIWRAHTEFCGRLGTLNLCL